MFLKNIIEHLLSMMNWLCWKLKFSNIIFTTVWDFYFVLEGLVTNYAWLEDTRDYFNIYSSCLVTILELLFFKNLVHSVP